MSKHPWYKRYPSDFIAGTLQLNLEQKGAYSMIIDLINDYGGPIPDDPQYIARACGCSVRKWNAIKKQLLSLGKIHITDGSIDTKRTERDRTSQDNLAENTPKNGDKPAENSLKTEDKREIIEADLAKINDLADSLSPDTRNQIPEEDTFVSSSAREETDLLVIPPRFDRRIPPTPIPDDWEPTDETRRVGDMEFYTRDETDWLCAGFSDHARQTDRRESDWQAAARRWLRAGASHEAIRKRRTGAIDEGASRSPAEAAVKWAASVGERSARTG